MPFDKETAKTVGDIGRATQVRRRTQDDLSRFEGDPVAFMRALVDPETGELFVPYPAQVRFLEEAFTVTDDGRLPFPELVFSAPKKSGKTAFGAVCLLYMVRVVGGKFAEGYCVANDYDQSKGRVFKAVARICEATDWLMETVTIQRDLIKFKATGATIQALASDYAGAAGSNPTMTVFDELWGYTSESAHRLWDEHVPPPTRKGMACRLTVTYAGFEGESDLLEGLYKRGKGGEVIDTDLYRDGGLLMYWTHTPPAPWQTDDWVEEMRANTRRNAYLRHVENQWVSSEGEFLPIEWWDACVDDDLRPVLTEPRLPVWVGLDGSVKHDATAIVVCAWNDEATRVRLVRHWIFQPMPDDPIDFEETVERTIMDMRKWYSIREIRYDPYQLVSVAQRLEKRGLPMKEFPQTVGNLTEASSNLYQLVKERNLLVYRDDAIRLAVSRCVALESARGWRITKEKARHRIDVVVAMAQAALGVVANGPSRVDHGAMGSAVLGQRISMRQVNPFADQGSWG